MKKNGNRKGNVRGIFLVSVFILCAALVLWRRWSDKSSSNPGQASVRDSLYQQQRKIAYGNAYLEMTKLVKSGDIIVRKGTDMTSMLLRRFNLKDPAYSHAGIVSFEHDTIFVYHALGGELNPEQPIQKDLLWNYGNPAVNQAIGLFRSTLDSTTLNKVLAMAKESWQLKIPFDTAFDLSTDDNLYCTEFVAKIFENAIGNSIFHRSELKGKIYIAVDDLTGNNRFKKLEAWKY